LAQTPHQSLMGYSEARSSAAVFRVPAPGYLQIAGADRVDFVQRQTTNDVRDLTPERSQLTVLTSATARILDVWRLVANPAGESIDVITLPGRGATTAAYLQRRIFFMDKVTVTDCSDDMALFEVFGPAAGDVLRGCGMAAELDQGACASLDCADVSVRVVALEGITGRGYWLLAPADGADALQDALAANGATVLEEDTYAVLRVEAGLPGLGELTETYTPLEVNLKRAVAGAKGCYTGQEIIARQITYDKVTRRLVGLRLDAPVMPGAAVSVNGRTVGQMTSAVESPAVGPVALAVIRRPHFEPGTVAQVEGGAGVVAARTVGLPFAGE